MDIKRNQIGDLNEIITINFAPSDYKEKVEKSLKDLKRKISEPGFRQGHVPMSLIEKKYGKSVLADELNKLTNDGLMNYFQENKLNILFEPIAKPENTIGDFDQPDNFSFNFEIGLRPEVVVNYEIANKVSAYRIVATAQEIDTEIASMRKRVGKFSSTEEVVDGDMLLVSLTPEEGESFTSTLILSYLKDEEQKKIIGKKLHDTFFLDTTTAFVSDYERSTFLKVKMDELENAPKMVTIKIDAVHHVEPADLDEEFFNKMFPDKSVTDEQGLVDRIKSQIELRYVNDANMIFRNKVIDALLDNISVTLPDNFIKQYLVTTNEQYTAENIDEQYENIRKSIVYQLLEGQIIADCKIEVKHDDVVKYINDYVRMSYFGTTDLSEEQEAHVTRFASEMIKSKENYMNAYDNLIYEKMTEGLKEKLNPKVKDVNYKEFMDEVSGEKKVKATKNTKTTKTAKK